MGSGIDTARAAGNEAHAKLLDDMKDQLIIVLMKRLAVDGKVDIPCAEIDGTGMDTLSFRVNPVTRVFHFELGKKQ